MNRIIKDIYQDKQYPIMDSKINCFENNLKNTLEYILFSVINNSNEAIMVLDNKNKIQCHNNNIYKLFPKPKDGYIGRNIGDVFEPALEEKILRKINENGNNTVKFNYSYKKNKNVTKYFLVKIKSIKSDIEGELSILYFIDRTKDVRINNELNKMKEMVQNASKLKSMFLSQMSHEIRTPINVIVNFTSLIKEDVEEFVSDDLKHVFNVIDKASRRIIRTIDLLLNFSEIQTHSYKCIFNKIDIKNNILLPIIREYNKVANNKGLEIRFYSDINSSKVIVDEYSTRRIIVQLIENAIKYTNKGYIDILLGNTADGRIKVKISDTGIGISKSYLPDIFKPFSQEYQGYTRKYDGNGIGLALVKEYCKLNKINITVNSTKNVGTVFTLVFENTLG